MKDDRLVGAKGESGARPAMVVTEFHFVHARRERLDNRAHLSAAETSGGQVLRQRNDVKRFWLVQCSSPLRLIGANVQE